MPTHDETYRVTVDLLARYVEKEHRTAADIRPADHIQNDLGLDSMSIMEFVADVEEKFDVSIPKDMYTSINTVADVAKAVETLKSR